MKTETERGHVDRHSRRGQGGAPNMAQTQSVATISGPGRSAPANSSALVMDPYQAEAARLLRQVLKRLRAQL
jgi:hypothetical protein